MADRNLLLFVDQQRERLILVPQSILQTRFQHTKAHCSVAKGSLHRRAYVHSGVRTVLWLCKVRKGSPQYLQGRLACPQILRCYDSTARQMISTILPWLGSPNQLFRSVHNLVHSRPLRERSWQHVQSMLLPIHHRSQ